MATCSLGHPLRWRREAARLCPSLAAGLPRCRKKLRRRRAARSGLPSLPSSPKTSGGSGAESGEKAQSSVAKLSLQELTTPALLMLLEMGGLRI